MRELDTPSTRVRHHRDPYDTWDQRNFEEERRRDSREFERDRRRERDPRGSVQRTSDYFEADVDRKRDSREPDWRSRELNEKSRELERKLRKLSDLERLSRDLERVSADLERRLRHLDTETQPEVGTRHGDQRTSTQDVERTGETTGEDRRSRKSRVEHRVEEGKARQPLPPETLKLSEDAPLRKQLDSLLLLINFGETRATARLFLLGRGGLALTKFCSSSRDLHLIPFC